MYNIWRSSLTFCKIFPTLVETMFQTNQKISTKETQVQFDNVPKRPNLNWLRKTNALFERITFLQKVKWIQICQKTEHNLKSNGDLFAPEKPGKPKDRSKRNLKIIWNLRVTSTLLASLAKEKFWARRAKWHLWKRSKMLDYRQKVGICVLNTVILVRP